MKLQLLKIAFLIFLFFTSAFGYCQQDKVSGVLSDSEGEPLPGVNVIIKGTTKGTVTNFEGEYKIICEIGDVLRFDFIGMLPKEITVTAEMFGKTSKTVAIEKAPVKNINSIAYKKAINRVKQTIASIPDIENSESTYNKNTYFTYDRIRNINVKKDSVKLTYFKPNIYFEVGFKTINSIQFVKTSNLPHLQNSYSQGVPVSGTLKFQGPETGINFSYGPRINSLEFDRANYSYDVNGRLINEASGIAATPYNNSIFQTTFKSSNNLFFNVSKAHSFVGLDITNRTYNDLYGVEKNKYNSAVLDYKFEETNVKWKAFVRYSNTITNQPNINGFQNNLLLNTWLTPASFSNSQGYTLPNSTQRSFVPNTFNNPRWLLNTNRNAEKSNVFTASVENTFKIFEDARLTSKLNYSNYKNEQNFGAVKNTNGFENGYLSNRNVEKNTINGAINFSYIARIKQNSELKLTSQINYTYQDLNYGLFQASGFNAFTFNNPNETSLTQKQLHRNSLRLEQRGVYKINNGLLTTAFSNNPYVSSIQNNKWFLPTLELKLDVNKLIGYTGFFDRFVISTNSTFDVNDAPLLYNNLSHNSTIIKPTESLTYRAINDLFVENHLKLEEKDGYSYNLALKVNVLGTGINFSFTHFNTTTRNAVFPVLEQGDFQLKNVADIKSKGVEMNLNANRIRIANNLYYTPSFVFSTYRTKVSKLLEETNRIPIAGFSTVSKNLIVGQPAGIIVGSAYKRDANNNIVIGDDGFPLIADETKIIGDPTPKYNLGFSNTFKWKHLSLDILIDVQKGGDVWNGTQNVLNYYGRSQQSAIDRNRKNVVFSGVNTQGAINTIPVDFYNPQNSIQDNKFVRYGFEGIAEDAIVEGSYINLKSMNLSYDFNLSSNSFFRTLNVGLYANNLFTWTKFRGASPYSSLFDSRSSNGLNFFNSPLVSEVGLKINVKI